MTDEMNNSNDINDFLKAISTMPSLDEEISKQAADRNAMLTKPPGALGRLEDIAIWYCGWRGDFKALVKKPQVIVFAGNHGVASLGVSAFPSEVTAQMVINFEQEGAAINQLCKVSGAILNVHSLELDKPTKDFSKGPALSPDEFQKAILVGWNSVDIEADLLVVGEMGIGNTTSAAAVACGLYGGDPEEWVGRGTGVDDAGLILKSKVVREGLKINKRALETPMEVLRCFGGREMVAMVGAISRARSLRIPVVLDGFICTVSAAVLENHKSGLLSHCLAGHLSSEGAHLKILDELKKKPLLDLSLRLGEASGGALAINIIKAALACHSGMATFEEASVSEKS